MTEQANPAFYNVSGPVHVYVRIPNIGAGPFVGQPSKGPILMLGHAEEAPEPDFVPQYIPVMSSLSGPKVPDDEIYVGGEYQVQLNLSRFSFSVIQTILAFPMYGRGATPGSETFLDRGRLVLANGDSFELWLRNAFYGTANSVAYPDMPIGYYYRACRSLGTYPRKLSRDATRAMLGIKPLSVRQGVTGGYITYSQDPAHFAELPLPG
jgi:hypothetical protein